MELLAELASESRSAFTRHSRGEGEGQGGGPGGASYGKCQLGPFLTVTLRLIQAIIGARGQLRVVQDISCSLNYYAYFFYSHED